MATFFIMPVAVHNALVAQAYQHRGYTAEEASAAAHFSHVTAWHGIRTHNALKALHLDELFGSKAGGCAPGAEIAVLPSRYPAVQRWNAHRKLGQAVGLAAMEQAEKLADQYGVGIVVVDNAFHYLWGGGYVIESARKGYIAYTNCTASLAEVVPFGGKFPTLGTNPHSWGFPTQDILGFPICVDWATSTVAMGRVQQFAREGRALPAGSGVDAQGRETTDPHQIKALLPFGQHKGYGLALIDELVAAYIGGSLPTIRNRWTQVPAGEKGTCCFFFQAIRPDALDAGDFAMRRTQAANVRAVVDDIRGHGNDAVLLPGQMEANNAALSKKYDGLLFTQAEIAAFAELAKECEFPFEPTSFKKTEIQ